MANVHVPVDPLDELRMMAPSAPDRLPAMLFLAALVHGILIIGVTFNPELTNPFADAISLEVTIVANPDQQIDRPDEAAYLAQASQEGGGNITDQIRPSAPLQSAMPADNQGREDGTAVTDAKAHERSADEVIATENVSDQQVAIDPRTDPQPQDTVAIAMEAGAEATLPLPQEEAATFLLTDDDPQQLIISADTRESVAAAYLDAWKRRIEAVGAAYLPELGELGKLRGSPTMLVRISENGELLEAHVSRSSGSPILDLASVDIIQRAAPFDEFPAEMAEEYDKVAFEYKFLFTEQLVPRD
jgi:protein TonB